MTVINPENNTGSKEHYDEFRTKWAIPFGRPGAAIDYAQCIFGLVTVRSDALRVHTVLTTEPIRHWHRVRHRRWMAARVGYVEPSAAAHTC